MMRPVRCCRCGCARFQKLQESSVELFSWTDGDAEYAYEQRVPGGSVVSRLICERCGNAAPIPPARWNQLRAADQATEEATDTVDTEDRIREEDIDYPTATFPIALRWRRIA